MKASKAFGITALIGALAGCGGGGSGSSTAMSVASSGPVASTSSFPINNTFTALAGETNSFTGSTKDSAGDNLILSVSLAPGPIQTNTTISATPKNTFTRTLIEQKNGVVALTQTFQYYFSASPFLIYGYTSNNEGNYSLASQAFTKVQTSQTAPPATATVGASGPLYTLQSTGTVTIIVAAGTSDIPGSAGQTLITQNATWSLNADTATTAWLCMNLQNVPYSYPNIISIETDCWKIDTSGNVLGFKATFSASGTTLQFQ